MDLVHPSPQRGVVDGVRAKVPTHTYNRELVICRQERQAFDQHLRRQPANSLTQVAPIHVLKLHENNLSGDPVLGRSNSIFFYPADDATSDELD